MEQVWKPEWNEAGEKRGGRIITRERGGEEGKIWLERKGNRKRRRESRRSKMKRAWDKRRKSGDSERKRGKGSDE